jgi:hypothetical protein
MVHEFALAPLILNARQVANGPSIVVPIDDARIVWAELVIERARESAHAQLTAALRSRLSA